MKNAQLSTHHSAPALQTIRAQVPEASPAKYLKLIRAGFTRQEGGFDVEGVVAKPTFFGGQFVIMFLVEAVQADVDHFD